ncbi:50S ribosomal protein L40e [Candidatus Woesearchaeota archaeon]|nr:50S ribosomal protein L40e [Candidatus Woesearchaeota archaeon]
MAKFPEAQARIFRRVFICKNCKAKIKTDIQRILKKEVSCKVCGTKRFRPIKKGK